MSATTNLSLDDEALVAATRTARTTFKVPAENLEALRARIADLNKRVDRLVKRGHDVARVVVKVGDLQVEKKQAWDRLRGCSIEVDFVYADVELVSPRPPKVDGWEFVAALTHVDDAGTVLRVCPGAQVSEGELRQYRQASSENCDHCHARRARADTFVVRDQQGVLKQVGRQCLRAYTGLANPEDLCAAAEILFSAGEALEGAEEDELGSAGGGGRRRGYASISAYLPFVACSIRVHGWLSRTAARETHGDTSRSTASLAENLGIFAMPSLPESERYHPEERDYNLAAATIAFCEEYFAGCDVDKLSDYENSLRVAMASGVLQPKLDGLVASAILFYKRDVERRARNESFAEMVASSTFQGQVGERGVFEGLRVTACREWSGDYGTTYFYAFCDENRNAFVYKASRDMQLEVEQVVSLRATVKKHEVHTPKFAGAKSYAQTQLTRAALVARARVVSNEVTEKYLGKMVAKPIPAGQFYADYEQVMEKVHLYHLVGDDGRKFVLQSKAKKKALVVGAVAVVEYEVVDLSAKNGGERPVSLVAVLS